MKRKRGLLIVIIAIFIFLGLLIAFLESNNLIGFSIKEPLSDSEQYKILASPTISKISINSSLGNNGTTEDILCWMNSTDTDGDTLNYTGYWYKNGDIFLNRSWEYYYEGDGMLDMLTGMDSDSENNMYVTGTTNSNNVFTIKFNSSGSQKWNATFDDGGANEGKVVEIDSQGDAVIGGFTENGNKYLVIKYNSSGSQKWNTTIQANGTDSILGITIDSNDNIYFTPDTDNGEGDSLFKLNSTGDYKWNATFDFSEAEKPFGGTTSDSNNNVYVSGYNGSGPYDIYLVKYNSSGSQKWNRSYDSGEDEISYGTEVGSNDNIYMVGYTNISGGKEYLLVKYNSTGDYEWNTTYDMPGATSETAFDIHIRDYNQIYVVGDAGGFDVGTHIVKYNSSGSQIWNKSYLGKDFGTVITVDNLGSIYIGGYPWDLRGSGGYDYYILKYIGEIFLKDQTQEVLTNVSELDSSFTSIDDNISCKAASYDGTSYSTYNFSSNLTVVDVSPVMQNLFVNSSNANNLTTGDITCWANATDPEGDTLNYTGYWYKNGVKKINLSINASNDYTQGTLTNVSILLNGNTSAGNKWECKVRAYDGNSYGPYDSSGNITIRSATSTTTTTGDGSSSYFEGEIKSEELTEGIEKKFFVKSKTTFNVKSSPHSLTVDEIFDETVTITIESNPKTINLTINETKKVDLDDDGVYDLIITLKEITKTYTKIAILDIKEISEEYFEEKVSEPEEEIVKEENNYLDYVLLGLFILVLSIVYFLSRKRK